MFVSELEEIKLDREALDAQTAAWLHRIAAYDRSEAWRAAGYWSAVSAISTECRIDRGVVSVELKLAHKLDRLPEVAEAFAAGEISERHAAVISEARRRRSGYRRSRTWKANSSTRRASACRRSSPGSSGT